MTVELIKPTKRRKMTQPRRTKIFLQRDGICFICRKQIRVAADQWFIEHPEALDLGGSDNDEDLWPAHVRCKSKKDAEDKAKIAYRNTIIDKGYVGKSRKKPWPKRHDPWGKQYRARQERRT